MPEKSVTKTGAAEPFGEAVTREPRLSDKIAEMMRQAIIARGLTAGTPLPSERELGEQFGVSRTVVREAVRALVAKGIVEVRSGSGLRVAAVDEDTVSESLTWYIRGGSLEYEQVHEIRSMIEVQMAGLAAERRTEEQLILLREAHEQLKSVIGDFEAAALADLVFHDLIARATQNDLFAVILGSIANALIEVRRETLAGGSGDTDDRGSSADPRRDRGRRRRGRQGRDGPPPQGRPAAMGGTAPEGGDGDSVRVDSSE